MTDIDTIVRQVSFSGWNEAQAGDSTMRKQVRLVLEKYGLPTTGGLFDRAYALHPGAVLMATSVEKAAHESGSRER